MNGDLDRCDVAVVGAGTAAFEAAVAAREGGAGRVIMLEKAPEHSYGGNARYTATGFRFVHAGAKEIRGFVPEVSDSDFANMHIAPYSEQDFMDDLLRVTEGRIDTKLARVLVDDSNESLHWMLGKVQTFQVAATRTVNGITYTEPGCSIVSSAESSGTQLSTWRKIADALDIELRFDSCVKDIHGNRRRAEGLQVSSLEGDYDLEARAVILCAGGFQASPEKRARYLGEGADLMKVRGSSHDTGEVLMKAIEFGAKTAGHWQGAHASPIDAAAPAFGVETSNISSTVRYSYVFGITVNSLGERFMDEGEAESVYTYAKTGRRLMSQPGAVCYQIFDQRLVSIIRPQYAGASRHEANTIGELAQKIGILPELLEHTVCEFNESTRSDIEFHPEHRDGKCTVGISPPKSNWATPIDSPPYLAYAVTGGITFTFGGLAVDEHAQVLNTVDEPIEGLYASGDIVGLFFHNYPSFSGQTRNVVLSRRAARSAMSCL